MPYETVLSVNISLYCGNRRIALEQMTVWREGQPVTVVECIPPVVRIMIVGKM